MVSQKNCGNTSCNIENPISAKFCSKCGQKFTAVANELTQPIEETIEKTIGNNQTIAQPKKNKKNQRVWIASLSTIFLVLIGGFIVSLVIFGSDHLVKNLKNAAESADVEAFMEQIIIVEDVFYDEKSYQEFLSNADLLFLAKHVEEQIEVLKNIEDESIQVFDYNNFPIFEITKIKKFGVFSNYELSPISFEVEVNTNLNKASMTISDITYQISEDTTTSIDKYLPGTYSYKLSVDSPYGNTTVENEFIVTNNWGNNIFVSMDFYTVKISADAPSAKLVINGEVTEQVIDGFLMLADIPVGQKVELSAIIEENDEKFESETYEINESSDINFSFPKYEEAYFKKSFTEEDIISFIESYRLDYENAVNSADFSIINKYLKEGTNIYRDYEKFVNDHATMDLYHYQFNENEYKDFKIDNDGKAYLTTFETFLFTSSDGNYIYERDKEYKIGFENQNYYIEEIDILNTNKFKQ